MFGALFGAIWLPAISSAAEAVAKAQTEGEKTEAERILWIVQNNARLALEEGRVFDEDFLKKIHAPKVVAEPSVPARWSFWNKLRGR